MLLNLTTQLQLSAAHRRPTVLTMTEYAGSKKPAADITPEEERLGAPGFRNMARVSPCISFPQHWATSSSRHTQAGRSANGVQTRKEKVSGFCLQIKGLSV